MTICQQVWPQTTCQHTNFDAKYGLNPTKMLSTSMASKQLYKICARFPRRWWPGYCDNTPIKPLGDRRVDPCLNPCLECCCRFCRRFPSKTGDQNVDQRVDWPMNHESECEDQRYICSSKSKCGDQRYNFSSRPECEIRGTFSSRSECEIRGTFFRVGPSAEIRGTFFRVGTFWSSLKFVAWRSYPWRSNPWLWNVSRDQYQSYLTSK